MEKHRDLSDDQFEDQFISGLFDAASFSHEAHIRLAWIQITRYGRKSAERNIQIQLKDFVTSVGASDKYHATVTIAAIKAVYHFIKKSQSVNFNDFINEFPRIKSNFRDLLTQHYSYDIFRSPAAKMSFVEPDLLPFD